MHTYIETALPLAEINEVSIRERAGRPGHPANLHMWWGRSPEASSLAALAATLLEYEEEPSEDDLLLLTAVICGDQEGMDAVKSRLPEQGNPPTVWDPFSGFGAIPIAAQKLGLKAVANDLNPVAAMLTSAAVDIPARFAALSPVHPGEAKRDTYSGAEGLAEDVQFYGEWLENQALKRLAETYPQTETGEIPFAWVWVRTVQCPNPACNVQIPLGSSYTLDKSKTSQHWAEPVVTDNMLHFVLHEGACPAGHESNKVGSQGAKFRCPVCGEVTTDDYIKRMGAAHKLGAEMMAVVTNTGGKRAFGVPDQRQKTAADTGIPEDVPLGTIPENAHWFSPPGFGITEYAQLFTPRQLYMLTTFSDLIHEAQELAASAALAAGMSEDGGTLEAGGTGALAYGQAVGVYLAFVVDKMADYNSSMCSWRTATGNIRSTFGRQAIPMVWTFAEGNPFSGVSGNYKSMLSSVVQSVECLKCGTSAVVRQENAITMEHPKGSLVCTELPYYRDIGYADLSDFFYIWLRRSLKETYPKMFRPMVTSKEELSTAVTYYGTAKDEAEAQYRADMKTVCEKLYASCSERYPALLFYCVRKNDLECIRQDGDGGVRSAWEHMLEILLSVGFTISAVWPMRSEPVSDKADSTRVLIVGRKGTARREQITRRGFITTLKRELPEKLQRLWFCRIPVEDVLLSGMGQGLSIFSSYESILNADGSYMNVHDALQIIYHECANDIEQRLAQADEDAAKPKEE